MVIRLVGSPVMPGQFILFSEDPLLEVFMSFPKVSSQNYQTPTVVCE